MSTNHERFGRLAGAVIGEVVTDAFLAGFKAGSAAEWATDLDIDTSTWAAYALNQWLHAEAEDDNA